MSQDGPSALPSRTSRLKAAWRQRVLDVVLAQLRQGVTPRKIALSVAIGLTFGMFPVLGTTSLLCLLAGVLLGLNQPIIQLANWAAAPLQLAGIYFFVRIGQWLTGASPRPFSIAEALRQFRTSPLEFLRQFGATGLRAVLAWLLIAPVLAALLYLTLLLPLRRLARTGVFR